MADLMSLIARDCERLERLAVLESANLVRGDHYPAGRLLAQGSSRFSLFDEQRCIESYREASKTAVEDCVRVMRSICKVARVVFGVRQPMDEVFNGYILWRLYELADAKESKIESEG